MSFYSRSPWLTWAHFVFFELGDRDWKTKITVVIARFKSCADWKLYFNIQWQKWCSHKAWNNKYPLQNHNKNLLYICTRRTMKYLRLIFSSQKNFCSAFRLFTVSSRQSFFQKRTPSASLKSRLSALSLFQINVRFFRVMKFISSIFTVFKTYLL